MATDFQRVPNADFSDQEEETKDELEFNLESIKSRNQIILDESKIQSPIESKYIEYNKSHRNSTINKAENSKILYELPEKEQYVASKLKYPFDADIKTEDWAYHPRLGDLEKREITIKINNKKGNDNDNLKTEKLWFAKDDKSSTRKVFISLKIKRISAIDNVRETFRMRFHIYLNWIMTEKEYRHYVKSKTSKYLFEPLWKPDLEFMNAVEIHKNELFPYSEGVFYKIEIFNDFYVEKEHKIVSKDEFDPSLCHFIRCKLECDITFAEELELQSFPFDCQGLSVIIKGNFLDKTKYIFLPELRAPNFGSIDQRYSVLDEWDLKTALIEFLDEKSGRKKGRTYPHIIIRLKVERKWKIYVLNIILLLFALTGLSLSAFYLNYEQLGERLGLLITLILTSIAYSIVIQDKLPNVSYLTFMDKYILASYAFLIVIVIESVLISQIENDEEQQLYFDSILFWIFFFLWIIIFGVYFSYYAYKLKQKEEEKLIYSSDEINEHVNKSLPTLLFDYKVLQRTGHGGRILSFQAIKDEDENKENHDYNEEIIKKHSEYTQMRRNQSLAAERTRTLQMTQ